MPSRVSRLAPVIALAALCGLPLAPPAAAQGAVPDDLRVEVTSVRRASRLVGDLLRSRDDDYLVISLRLRAAQARTIQVHPRASFAVLSAGQPPVKYPVSLVGYFDPESARPTGIQEAIVVTEAGVAFSIAAEVPRSESRFRLAVQRPAAEAALGSPNTIAPTPLKPLAPGGWEGRAANADLKPSLFRLIPGTTGLDTMNPRRNVFMDLDVELRNASGQPQAVTAADLVLVDAVGQTASPLGLMGARGRVAAPVAEAKPVAPQAAAPPLRPVWDVARGGSYTLRVYARAADLPLAAAVPAGEITVDTAEGHLIAGREHQAFGRPDKAMEEYQIVVRKFPGSDAESEARARIADVEVARVRGQNFAPLPPAERAGRYEEAADMAKVEITNAANDETLTVYYSGPSSQTLVVKPGETKSAVLRPGPYKVAAKGSPRIRPYSGDENVAAGYIYKITYYIIRREQP